MSQNRKVKTARLHQAIQIVGYGSLGGSVAVESHGPKAGGKPGIDVSWTGEGLLILAKNKTFEVLIPAANVVMMEFALEENEKVRIKDSNGNGSGS